MALEHSMIPKLYVAQTRQIHDEILQTKRNYSTNGFTVWKRAFDGYKYVKVNGSPGEDYFSELNFSSAQYASFLQHRFRVYLICGMFFFFGISTVSFSHPVLCQLESFTARYSINSTSGFYNKMFEESKWIVYENGIKTNVFLLFERNRYNGINFRSCARFYDNSHKYATNYCYFYSSSHGRSIGIFFVPVMYT